MGNLNLVRIPIKRIFRYASAIGHRSETKCAEIASLGGDSAHNYRFQKSGHGKRKFCRPYLHNEDASRPAKGR